MNKFDLIFNNNNNNIDLYLHVAHNNQEDSLCALQELSYIYSENR